MKKLLLVCWLVSFSSVQAASFQGNSTGEFLNPTGPSDMVTTGVGTNQFAWGESATNSPSSSLGYEGKSFDVIENDEFVFGSLSFFNGTIFLSTRADTIDLSVSLNFTEPSGIVEEFVYDLGLISTPSSTVPDADIVNFDKTVPTNFFSSGGTDFTLEFVGFGTLSGEGFTVEDSFRVLEEEIATVDLVGRITSTPSIIPVPTAVWLFGSGIFGLLGFSRRKA